MEAKSHKSDKKGKLTIVDADGKVVVLTEGDGHKERGRASPTKLTEESDEAVCRICWGTEQEAADDPEADEEPNPLISPCKCTGTMGYIHLKCLRGWLDTMR